MFKNKYSSPIVTAECNVMNLSVKMNIEIKKNLAKNWFILLRDIICYEIEELEKEFGTKKNKIPKKFKSQIWRK